MHQTTANLSIISLPLEAVTPDPINIDEFYNWLTADAENAEVLDFFREGYHRLAGNYIQVKNYVGLIQMKSGFQIQILPKIHFNVEEDITENMHVLLHMLKSMKDFPAKAFYFANLGADKTNLYEIFISMYLFKVQEIVKSGLKSAYIEQEDNLPYLRG